MAMLEQAGKRWYIRLQNGLLLKSEVTGKAKYFSSQYIAERTVRDITEREEKIKQTSSVGTGENFQIIVKVFVGSGPSPHDAAEHAQSRANTFLLNEQVSWGQAKHISTSLSTVGRWSDFTITLVIELPENRGVELMQS